MNTHSTFGLGGCNLTFGNYYLLALLLFLYIAFISSKKVLLQQFIKCKKEINKSIKLLEGSFKYKSFYSCLLILGMLLLPVSISAEELQPGKCEMTIKSDINDGNHKAQAIGDCAGLVEGYYQASQNLFMTYGGVTMPVSYSGQQFQIGTPKHPYGMSILTVYINKVEASKEESKAESKDPKEEDKPITQEPKEENKPDDSTKETKKSNNTPSKNKPSTTQNNSSSSSNQSSSSSNDTTTENNQEQSNDGIEEDDNTINEDKSKEDQDETSKEQEEESLKNQKIRDLLQKDDSEITRVWTEVKNTQVKFYKVDTDHGKVTNQFIYIIIGAVIILLLFSFRWWSYKRKSS
jgi:flagellar biosynthesis GTPase FlhF